ncbi:MAG TPA: chromosome segregation protein SMC, partial [Gammaproteobacteria bacterium]
AHLLLGTGLGAHGYSIIEQGMISRLVEAKPEELRAFLEEAAGISKYKERRRDTEHRIRHTRENLDRLCDLCEEVDKQLAHLKRQANGARRYKTLKEDQRRVGAELLALRLRALAAETRSRESDLNERQVKLDATIADQRALEARIERLRVTYGERTETFNEIQGSNYRVGAEIARLEQSIKHRKETRQHQTEDLESTNRRLEEISAHIADDLTEIEEFERLLSELNPDLERARHEQREAEEVLAEAEAATENWRLDWERVTGKLAETEQAREVEKARIEQLSTQRQRLEREGEKLGAEREGLSTAELERTLELCVAEEEALKAACDEAARVSEAIWHQIQSLRELNQTTASELDALRGRLQKDRGRLTSLEALQEAALGDSDQVSGWLDSQSLRDSPRLAQSLKVEPGWDRAVETVLGGYLQAVCIEDFDAVAAKLSGLTDGGIALLSTAPSDYGRADDAGLLSAYVTGPGIAHLLDGVRIADSLDDALTLRRRLGRGESVITRDGVWIGRDWLRINRTDDPRAGVLARGDEIKRLAIDVETGERRVADAEKALAEAREQLERAEKSGAKALADAGETQRRYAEKKGELDTTRARLDQERSRIAALSRSLTDLDSELRSISNALHGSQANVLSAGERHDDLEIEQANLEATREQIIERYRVARNNAEAARKRVHDLTLTLESRRSSKESATIALARVRNQQNHLLSRRDELASQISSSLEPLAGEESALTEQLDERLKIETELASARRAMELVDDELRSVEQERTDKEQSVNSARETLDESRLRVRETQVRAEAVREQFDETRFELDTLNAELPEDATIQIWEENFEKIERRIHRLGNINLAAIDEYKEQAERKEYLDAQFADLTDALETLEQAIRKIDKETRTRFKETFDQANSGLGKLFPRLFGGGHAYLDLDGDDFLSSGVTVMARPPGKRISTIHLMSGGEKALTAVALVFSIFELNPAPFCLLDEVDAPLDDANVGRFSEIVKEMSQQVQFVLITHNKTTMEAMQQLIGVTMSEPGVSRLVAVDIDEAVQLAAS